MRKRNRAIFLVTALSGLCAVGASGQPEEDWVHHYRGPRRVNSFLFYQPDRGRSAASFAFGYGASRADYRADASGLGIISRSKSQVGSLGYL